MGTRNFKSNKAYHKWLAYGHIHGDFQRVVGDQLVKIKGRIHRVLHGKRRR